MKFCIRNLEERARKGRFLSASRCSILFSKSSNLFQMEGQISFTFLWSTQTEQIEEHPAWRITFDESELIELEFNQMRNVNYVDKPLFHVDK